MSKKIICNKIKDFDLRKKKKLNEQIIFTIYSGILESVGKKSQSNKVICINVPHSSLIHHRNHSPSEASLQSSILNHTFLFLNVEKIIKDEEMQV